MEKLTKEEKKESFTRGMKALFCGVLLFCSFIFYSIGNMVGTFQTALNYQIVEEITELKLKYNQTKEFIYLNSTCDITEKDITLAKQEMFIKYSIKGYLEETDINKQRSD